MLDPTDFQYEFIQNDKQVQEQFDNALDTKGSQGTWKCKVTMKDGTVVGESPQIMIYK